MATEEDRSEVRLPDEPPPKADRSRLWPFTQEDLVLAALWAAATVGLFGLVLLAALKLIH